MKMRQKNRLSQKSEQDLWREEAEMMHLFRQNRESNLLTLISLFKGHYLELTGSILFFILKHSPTWVLPVVTANIINAVTDHNGNITRILLLNTVIMIVFFVQNIPTNYIHTWLYAKTVRTVERELREALVCKLQQLSITYHKENAVRKAAVKDYARCGTNSESGFSDFHFAIDDYSEHCSFFWSCYF